MLKVALQAGKLWLAQTSWVCVCNWPGSWLDVMIEIPVGVCDWPGRWLDVMIEIPASVWLARQVVKCDDWDTCQCVIGQIGG